MKNLKTQTILPLSALLLAVYTLIFPLQCSFYINRALKMCLQSLIPSLFPFIFLMRFYGLTKQTGTQGHLALAASKITGVCPALCDVMVLGLFSGFPTGAVGTAAMYQRGLCSKADAERAIALSNNCSAAFIISVVGAKIIKSVKIGYLLLLSQTLSVITSAVIINLLFPKKRSGVSIKHPEKQADSKPLKFSEVFTFCIRESVSAMLGICGYVMFFSLLSGIIGDALLCPLEKLCTNSETLSAVSAVISGFFEMSFGVFAAETLNFPRNILVCSLITGFSGIAVYFQVSEICLKNGFSTNYFVFSHILCAILNLLYTVALLFILPDIFSKADVTSKGLAALSELLIPTAICTFGVSAVAIKRIFSAKKKKTGE